MSNPLDHKNGKPFEAETEYLYQKKISELQQLISDLLEAYDSQEGKPKVSLGVRVAIDRLRELTRANDATKEG